MAVVITNQVIASAEGPSDWLQLGAGKNLVSFAAMGEEGWGGQTALLEMAFAEGGPIYHVDASFSICPQNTVMELCGPGMIRLDITDFESDVTIKREWYEGKL